MAFDLIIRDGLIVDGTGSKPFHGDIAIQQGTIAEIGNVSAKAQQEIDADDALVTPGFIDLHTHFDAQITWDPSCSPSTSLGVTSILMGNCGFCIAPCKPSDRDLTLRRPILAICDSKCVIVDTIRGRLFPDG